MLEKIKILILDRDGSFGLETAIILEDNGYNVSVCGDSRQMISAVLLSNIDVVLLDLKLPDINSLQLLHEIRASSADVIIILVTNNSSAESSKIAMKNGVFGFIKRPVNAKELIVVIRNAASQKTLSMREEGVV